MSEQMTQKAEATVRDALDHARTAAQEFHQAISGVLAKRPDAKKAEIEGAIQKAKTAAEFDQVSYARTIRGGAGADQTAADEGCRQAGGLREARCQKFQELGRGFPHRPRQGARGRTRLPSKHQRGGRRAAVRKRSQAPTQTSIIGGRDAQLCICGLQFLRQGL